LYQICLLTGDNGQDATSLYHHPHLLGHLFAAPYGLFEPSLAFAAEDTNGVGGYIAGALDTRAFQQRPESTWWPGLRARYPDPGSRHPGQQVAHLIHHPWRTGGRADVPSTASGSWRARCSRLAWDPAASAGI